jgi:1,4-dihydroxy-2-naphthoate octaprenyltransferase
MERLAVAITFRGEFGTWLRAGRVAFLSASFLPFTCGVLVGSGEEPWGAIGLGALAVAGGHLYANLLNDHGDARTGVDERDPMYWRFFGGSKLIQEGRRTARSYWLAAMIVGGISALCVVLLAALHEQWWALGAFAGVMFLAAAYSLPPLRLSYRHGGEVTVFLLFGPAATLAGHFARTGELWSVEALLYSVPLGLMTMGILIANEVPDAQTDAAGGKRNLIGLFGRRKGWMLYGVVVVTAMACIACLILVEVISSAGWLAMLGLIPAGSAVVRMRIHYADKTELVGSAKRVILAQILTSLGLMGGVAA